MNYTGPKVKLSRALGIPLTPKAARVIEKKPHPPGAHGTSQTFRVAHILCLEGRDVEPLPRQAAGWLMW